MKILITSPSLDERVNVSGISTMVREIKARTSAELIHFQAGRKDGEPVSLRWLFNQILLPLQFFGQLRAVKPDVVHVNTAFIKLAIMRDAALIFAARLAGRPVVINLQGGPYVRSEFTNPFLKAIATRMVAMSERLVVPSTVEKDVLATRFPGAAIDVHPNAIALDSVVPRDPTPDVRTITFFARHHHSKGLIHVIDTSRELEADGVQFKFTCYGTGPEADWFVGEMAKVLGPKFDYGGVLAGRDKWVALSRADIFFLPSRDEGLPFALLEAMASGCVPVIADSGGVSSVIENGRNGFIIEAAETKQTAAKLKELLDPETDLQSLRDNARRTVEENFNMDNYTERLEELYEEVVKKNGRG